jgi:hypothetical protein
MTAQWEEIYRGYTQQELTTELTQLKKSLAGGFVSQGSGSVSGQKDVMELRDRLQAATRVWNEKFSNGGNADSYRGRRGTVDFSGVDRRSL